jgi:TRAP-type mannitol/chloroaromatic compound transport system substrate-binding protein
MENEAWVLPQFEANNGAALQTLINKHKVQLFKFPDEVFNALRPMAVDVLEEEAAKSPMAKKVNESFKNFQKVVGTWGTVSEKAYFASRFKDCRLAIFCYRPTVFSRWAVISGARYRPSANCCIY